MNRFEHFAIGNDDNQMGANSNAGNLVGTQFRVQSSEFQVATSFALRSRRHPDELGAGFRQTASSTKWVVAPFVGSTAGDDATQSATTVGVSGGWRGDGWLGVEGDLGWTPEFFEQDGFRTTRRVLTLMGNGVLNVPTRSNNLRPYVSGGLGLFHPRLSEAGGIFDVDARKLGWDAGGGAEFFQGSLGVRGDLEVLPRTPQDRRRRQRVRSRLFDVRVLARDRGPRREILKAPAATREVAESGLPKATARLAEAVRRPAASAGARRAGVGPREGIKSGRKAEHATELLLILAPA